MKEEKPMGPVDPYGEHDPFISADGSRAKHATGKQLQERWERGTLKGNVRGSAELWGDYQASQPTKEWRIKANNKGG